ncbi:MAG: glycyl-radical enzyme activating protein [Bacteroidales bacterium]|nr:glycyl-radical enzyme activating protein [Bacteroidales bacterium]
MNNIPSPDSTSVRVSSIQRFSIHDGPGIRTTVFLQGCPLRCPWCANPETQDPLSGKMMSVSQILSVVERDADYYRHSGGGVTFSGGEPLMQPDALEALLKASKASGFHTAVETSGETAGENLLRAEPFTDIFLFDIKHCDAKIFRKVCSGSLDTILRNLEALSKSGKVIARIPCIPAFNMDADTVRGIFALALSLGIKEAHLLPYHTLAKDKYARLGRTWGWEQSGISKEDVEPFACLGREAGLRIRIGG